MNKCKNAVELPDEIWIEIMRKLSIKPLHRCKCVSKTWYSFVTHILSCHKGLELPPCGLLFLTKELQPILSRPLCYLSFGDRKITPWSTGEEPKPKTAIVGVADHQNTTDNSSCVSLGNLTVDFSSCLVRAPKCQRFWTMHRGLVLLGSVDTLTFNVYNPVTKEKFILPKSPYLVERFRLSKHPPITLQGAIINLSDCLLSTQCNFRVIRFSRKEGRFNAEVYSSCNNQWFQSELWLDEAVSRWTLCGSVILDKTVFFLTDNGHVVGLKLLSGEKLSASCLCLPQPIQNGMGEPASLYASQGYLYLLFQNYHDLWIWKHDGKSLDAQAWIPQLIFKDSGISICPPVAKKYLSQLVGNSDYAFPLIMHPEAPVVFILMLSSIFAFDLLNDTVEKIADVKDNIVISMGYVYMYSPCFASLEGLMHQTIKKIPASR